MGTLGTLGRKWVLWVLWTGSTCTNSCLDKSAKRADCQEHRSAYVVIIKPVHQGDRFVESVKTLSILGAVFVILTLFLLPLFEGLRWVLQSCPCHFVRFGFRGRTFVRRLPLHQAGLFYETRSVSVAAAAAVWLAVCTTCVAAVAALIWLPIATTLAAVVLAAVALAAVALAICTASSNCVATAAVWLAVCTASTTCVAAVLIWLPSWGRC
jgi:hypothetical protein